MEGKASFTFMSIIAAMREPVHAPVPGRGMATKRNRPQKAYFFTVSILPMARFSSRVTRLSSQRLFVRSQAKIFLMNTMINGTGTRFPMIATGIAHQKGRPCATAIGIAPRSSTTGTMEIRNVMTILPKKLFQRFI